MSLIDKIIYTLSPGQRKLRETADEIYEIAFRNRYFLNPQDIGNRVSSEQAEQLSEADSRYADFYRRLYNGDVLLQYGADSQHKAELDFMRENSVKVSRQLYRTDVNWQQMIRIWTNFGFGERIELTPRDEVAADVWEEFLTADRNRALLKPRNMHKLSDQLLVDGELFLVFFVSTLDGTVTLRKFDPLNVTRIITDPDDTDLPLLYERNWTSRIDGAQVRYYQDYLTTDDEIKSARSRDKNIPREIAGDANTRVYVMHVPHQTLDQRGWPLLFASEPWLRAYRDFLQDRAAIAKVVASRVDKIKYKGGQRALEALQATLQSSLMTGSSYSERNPSPIAGSIYLENQQSDRQAMPLSTAASDAQIDGSSLLSQVGLGAGIFPHWMGRGESYRLATAEAMEVPVMRQFSRYQAFWADVERDMARFVLSVKEEYGGVSFSTKDMDVSTDIMLDIGIREKSRALNNYYERGLLPKDVAMRIAMQSLGVKEISEILKREQESGTFDAPEESEDAPELDEPNQEDRVDSPAGGSVPGDSNDSRSV
jgi:hypothetical protein